MDAEITDAVAAVDIDTDEAADWFDLVAGAHSASGGDWDVFSERLNATAGGTFGTAAEAFLRYAADHGKIELIDKLVANLRELPSAYASSRKHASPWDTVVREFGSDWAGWDGSEGGWVEFRDWTYSSANARDPDLYAVAYEKLHPLGERPLPERIATLMGLGFTISAPSAQSAQSTDSLWETVVRQFGPGWANWDGSDTGWVEFRDWTYSSANAQDPELYGVAYERLDPLNGLPPAQRAAKLIELGFGVTAPSAEQPIDQIIEDAVAEALLEVPGSEALTPEQLVQMRTEIAEELARESAQ
jgi:hypothetical protein